MAPTRRLSMKGWVRSSSSTPRMISAEVISPQSLTWRAGKFLAVADGAAGLDDADDVAVGRVPVLGIAAAEIAADRGGAAVVIDDAGIEAGGIEIGRVADEAADGLALLGLEAPVLALAEADVR